MFTTVVVGILGLLVGSFLNAVIWRLHVAKSVTDGRSMCPQCRHTLAWYDLIPLFSWLWLRARCRYCGKPISAQYPAVELLTAIIFALTYHQVQPTDVRHWLQLGFWLYFIGVLIVLTVYDLQWYLIPDKVLLPAIVVGFVYLALFPDLHDVAWHLVAALIAGGSFYLLAAVSKGKWMGGGDIKLAFLMGLLLGTQTWLAMVLAFNLAAVIALILIGLKLRRRRDYIPFGPFLAGATVITFLYGQQIINWYLQVSKIGMLQ